MRSSLVIREVRPEEFASVGALLVTAYESLPGMPKADELPAYYAMLRDVVKRAGNPAIRVFAAESAPGEIVGSVDFIDDLKHYGASTAVRTIPNGAGIRLLAVKPEARGMGVGKALTQFCIERARQLGRSQVVLHTTRVMQTAWAMYERLGFQRFPEIDFQQGSLEVFGFRMQLTRDPNHG